jgi:hypothetical protein
MRGHARQQGPMFLMINVADKVPQDHPLRAVKRRCDLDMRLHPARGAKDTLAELAAIKKALKQG